MDDLNNRQIVTKSATCMLYLCQNFNYANASSFDSEIIIYKKAESTDNCEKDGNRDDILLIAYLTDQ